MGKIAENVWGVWHPWSMRRQIPTAIFVAISSVVVFTGCGAAPRSSPKPPEATFNVAEAVPAAGPRDPPVLPFRLPCGENDLDGCTKGCDEHVIEDCTTLASIYYEGKGIEANQARGIELFRVACLGDSPRACMKLADLYHAAVITDDPAAEAWLYSRACEAGANRGCVGAGRAYLEGRGVNANAEYASKYFARVCERGNAESCLELAKLYDRGEGVKKDSAIAMRLYTKACQLGLGEACVTADPKGEVDAAPPRE